MLKTDDLDAAGRGGLAAERQGHRPGRRQAIGFTTPHPSRAYIPRNALRLILTLTNLNGIAYRIGNFGEARLPTAARVNLGESYVDHADFATSRSSTRGQTDDRSAPRRIRARLR